MIADPKFRAARGAGVGEVAVVSFHVKNVSRGAGSNAVARAAYISREKLRDEHLNRSYDFRARGGLEHAEILLPSAVRAQGADWARDRSNLWNTAEQAEVRRNSRVAREYVVALPHELSAPERLMLARDFAQTLSDRYSVAADLAVHSAPAHNDRRNVHAHILTTTREIGADGLGRKAVPEYNEEKRQSLGLVRSGEEIRQLRHLWVDHANQRLRESGIEIVLDARSYWEQGSSRLPAPRLSLEVKALERAGIATEVAAVARAEHARAQERANEYAAAYARSLAGKEAARELATPVVERPLSLEERQARAAARWAEYRREYEAGRRPAATEERERERDRGPEL